MVGNKTGRKTGKEYRPKFLEHLVAETLSWARGSAELGSYGCKKVRMARFSGFFP